MKLAFKIIVFFTVLACWNCEQTQNNPVYSFYYWKTTFSLSNIENEAISENQVKSLYIRYFDIDLDQNQKPYPLSPITFAQKTGSLEVIPVIYVKNKVMLLKNSNLKVLAEKITHYIDQINKKANIECTEIQVDCDWTLESRDNFLKFIDLLKMVSHKKLSATIRLHQVKYYMQTKIPNVDYGVLMFYNMGTIAPDSLNSIYDIEIAKKYISSLKNYPLKLQVALPIFSWGIQTRNNKVLDLISRLNEDSFKNDSNYVIQPNHYFLVKNSNIKFGCYFKKEDRIKIESISFNDLKGMLSLLKENLRKTPEKIIFYDLDSTNLMNYKNENQSFKKIINYF